MKFTDRFLTILLFLLFMPSAAPAGEPADSAGFSYRPELHGTIRAKYEYEPQIRKSRFEIRNARVSVEGKILKPIIYKAEIDLSDEGSIKMLDAYIRYQPSGRLRFTVGQMRVPFTIDAHRSPHTQYFANRSFIAKQVGNVRDVGVAPSWTFGKQVPVTLEGGIFNGSGLTRQKHFWTGTYNFSFKAQAQLLREITLEASCQRASVGDMRAMLYDAGAFWDNGTFHVEAEYLRKHYRHNAFRPVNAVDFFAVYRRPLKGFFSAISFLGRYDYMSDHNSGGKDDAGVAVVDDPERHRLTAGVTLSLGKKKLQADVRINYEQYFYARGVEPGISDRNKLVVEFVARF